MTAPRRNCARALLLDALLVLVGSAVTLAVYGYRFGEGNHSIYLLEPLRQADPRLLGNDWFTTQTLQYHAIFGWVTRMLLEWDVARPVFLASYLLLMVLFHAAWLGIARHITGSRASYLPSLAAYYLSAAGTGLGFYQFFQDSSLLPSNIANVAMLWGIGLWVRGRFIGGGASFGVAGLFHLNHAVVGVAMLLVLALGELYRRQRTASTGPAADPAGRKVALASLLALAPSTLNIMLAARIKLQRTGFMPLEEFVELYVRLRHPHHYDPSSWPAWLWIAFAWAIPLAVVALWRRPCRRVAVVLAFVLALQVLALLFAGAWYVSETLVQMSLYRFSIFAQLLACILAAGWIVRGLWTTRLANTVAALAAAAIFALCVWRGPFFGLVQMPEDDAEYLELCDWVRAGTPIDAVFLVPPSESSFRLRARRAIVVNFKAVPQLSGELTEWRERLQTVLDLPRLESLPRGYHATHGAIAQRYRELPGEALRSAARMYAADYVITMRPLEAQPGARLVYSTANQRYLLYHLEDEGGRE